MESFGILFGRLIREKRGIENLSQDRLAVMCGLAKARISDIETGKINNPQAKTVDALCVALNISREERNACRGVSSPRLPPRLLENLALRFGHNNPDASENDLEDFLKEKADEFHELQKRLARLTEADGQIRGFVSAANAALEAGDFQLADARLADAEAAQLALATIPALETQYRLRFERGHAALLAGEIIVAVDHWENAARYFTFIDKKVEVEKRYEYVTRLQEYGYRYRNVEALFAAKCALEVILTFWEKGTDLKGWCRAMLDMGRVYYRLSEYDRPAKYGMHSKNAKSIAETVREATSASILPYYHAESAGLLANIYFQREFASCDAKYRAHLEIALRLENDHLGLISKIDTPDRWGVWQHNLGLIYARFCRYQSDKHRGIENINLAIEHLEASFDVRDPESPETFQYWVASCRSLGEALIERALIRTGDDANNDISRAFTVLTKAAAKISESDHPNQWDEIQEQLARCSNHKSHWRQ